ncbi:NADP-dependent oxidoreductase [Dyadobacter sp. MSC1_007]|jgi:NADPH:quinone reductase-like Zn-dependent oxidoreductase|uniref:NADP-dependent oxidoreductase n=1 Tax=Dyadobacter sp. MSC1_007 TaxID=2909264 RepID=UPI00202E0093|nr:NADP-dependent oxidoreductase [Dyadobacter sp. MSC1_007]
MKAIVLKREGDQIKGLITADIPIPVISDNDVLIKVNAIDINPVDNKTLHGNGQFDNVKNDEIIILGWDVSGVISEVGKDVVRFKAGDAVFGLLNFPGHGKTYAQYVAADPAQLAIKPANVDDETAAATTMSALMAYQAIREARIKPGERVLIQGVAGGVGFFALQIAKQLGAYVIGTAAGKHEEFLRENGLDEMINFQTADFELATSNIDFIFDTLGGKSVIKGFNILNPNGRLITIPSGQGEEWKELAKEHGVNAQFLFVHSSGEDMQALAALLEQGIIKPNIAHRFKFDDIADIHERMSTGKISGKIVVSFN